MSTAAIGLGAELNRRLKVCEADNAALREDVALWKRVAKQHDDELTAARNVIEVAHLVRRDHNRGEPLIGSILLLLKALANHDRVVKDEE